MYFAIFIESFAVIVISMDYLSSFLLHFFFNWRDASRVIIDRDCHSLVTM